MRAARVKRGRASLLATIGCAAWCVTLSPGGAASPQTSQPVEEAGATIPYVDPTFGFEMRLPAGWQYERGRFAGPAGAHGLLRGRMPSGAQALQILVFRSLELSDTGELPSFDEWLASFERQLGELHGTKLTVRKHKNLDRPRAVLVADPQVAGRRTTTHYLCIPFDPNTVWVLVFAATVANSGEQAAVRAQFDQIAASVRVLYDPLQAAEIAAAFERGLAVLKELRAGAGGVEIDREERYYDITIGDKPIGYLLRWMRPEAQALDKTRSNKKRKRGLRVHEESWRFADDGTVRHTVLDLFSSFDLRSELIENRTTQFPAPDVQSQRLYIELDQCVREDKVLVSSFSTNLDAHLPDPRPPLPVGPRYLDLAWVRMLPRLLLKAPSEAYAFAIYASQARGLMVHIIRPLGPAEIPPQGGAGYAFETRAGFVEQPSRVYTDTDGNVVRIESADLALTLTTKDEVERKYAERREPARRRMQSRPRARTTP